ncbi:hypothetical protein GCM10012275_56130 [Longimycelium tulufanense]|uniref:Uncharacterized protein n=1 Tax=Longimycelium tulufanense TaxID=907463 RepID=A0A8J3CJT7_9PSEU|nr:hypothetical protein [Longimycelium tulufanense]GGM78263.1 hypothetical protein GCM10012275_56130 [Longimycelium tulufanense]
MVDIARFDKYCGPLVDADELAEEWYDALTLLAERPTRDRDPEARAEGLAGVLSAEWRHWSHAECLTRLDGWETAVDDYVSDTVRVDIVAVAKRVTVETGWKWRRLRTALPGVYAVISVGQYASRTRGIVWLSNDPDHAEGFREHAFYRCLDTADVSCAAVGCASCDWEHDTGESGSFDWATLTRDECLDGWPCGDSIDVPHCPECGSTRIGFTVY